MSAIEIDRWNLATRDLIADALEAVNPDTNEAQQIARELANSFRPTDMERTHAVARTVDGPCAGGS